MDQLQWWLDHNGLSIPEEVEATGRIPAEGLFDTLVHWDAKLHYRNGREVTFSDVENIAKHFPKLEGFKPGSHGTLFVGSEGWVSCARDRVQTSSPALRAKLKNPGPKQVVQSNNHLGNFIDAILGKNPSVTSLASAIRSDIACHLVDQSVRHGSPIQWDNDRMTITNHEKAKAAMQRPMREPWNVLNKKYT
jgi:hypothetical protein